MACNSNNFNLSQYSLILRCLQTFFISIFVSICQLFCNWRFPQCFFPLRWKETTISIIIFNSMEHSFMQSNSGKWIQTLPNIENYDEHRIKMVSKREESANNWSNFSKEKKQTHIFPIQIDTTKNGIEKCSFHWIRLL